MDIKSLIKERDREDEGVEVPIYPRGFEPDPEAEDQAAPITFTMLGRDATAVKDVLDRQAREWQAEIRKSKGKFPKIDPAKTYANRVDVAVAALVEWDLDDPMTDANARAIFADRHYLEQAERGIYEHASFFEKA
jgi:hypothetical protein